MANQPIPTLPVAISLDGSEQIEIVQPAGNSGTSKRTTVGAVSTFPSSTGTLVTVQPQPELVSSRQLAVESGPLTLTDGGAQGLLTVGVATGGIANAKLAVMAATTIKANLTGGNASPTDATVTSVLDLIGSTLGNILYRGSTNWTALAGNATSTKKFLRQTGTGAVSAAPAWDTIATADVPSAALTSSNDTNVTLTLGGTPATALLVAASIAAGWTGQLSLARGGTANSLTASNGGIVWSDASKLNILAGTATANQILLSGATATPAWSSATINQGLLTVGLAGTLAGQIGIAGVTSGTVTQTAQSVAGTPTITWGTSTGTPAVTATSGLSISTTTGQISISANGIALSALAQISALSLLGNTSSATGNVVSFAGTANQIPIVNSGATALAFTTVSGDLTNASGAFTIANGAVTNAKLANASVTYGTTAVALGASSTVIAGLTSVATAVIGPTADSTTALKITKANLSTAVVTVDTTNSRVGINKTPGAFDLDVNGAVNLASTLAVTGHITAEGVSSTGATGTGKFVFDTTPTFTTSMTTPIAIGGTGAASTLELRATTGAGVGSEAVNITIGSNGNRTAITTSLNPNNMTISRIGFNLQSGLDTVPPAASFVARAAAPDAFIDQYRAGYTFYTANGSGSVGLAFINDGGAGVGTSTVIQMVANNVTPALRSGAAMVMSVQDTAAATFSADYAIQTYAGGTFATRIYVSKTGGVEIGATATDPGIGGLFINAQIFMPNITTSSAAQTGTVCWTTGTGKFTVDTTVGCLTSIEDAKHILARLEPVTALGIVNKLNPFSFRYRRGWGDSGRYEQFGLGARQAAAIDERLVGRDSQGHLQGVRYEELTAVLVGAIQRLETEINQMRDARA